MFGMNKMIYDDFNPQHKTMTYEQYNKKYAIYGKVAILCMGIFFIILGIFNFHKAKKYEKKIGGSETYQMIGFMYSLLGFSLCLGSIIWIII